MSFDKELVSIQYSLTLLLGQDLHLTPMLKKFLPSALKLLECSGGCVWLRGQGDGVIDFDRPVYSYPTIRPEHYVIYSRLLSEIGDKASSDHLDKPELIINDGTYYHIFPIGTVGVLSLRRSRVLQEKYILALKPIIERLAIACVGCLDHEDLMSAQKNTMEAMKKAEEANKAKTEFLATMSHELRTPLNGVLGLTSLTLDTDLTTEQRDNLKSVKSSAKGLLSIIDEILDVSSIESHSLSLKNESFHLQPLIENTIRGFSLRSLEEKFEFGSTVSPLMDCIVETDSNRLKQILMILLDNAFKFTEKGTVSLSVDGEIFQKNRLRVNFVVADTGIGISQFDQEKIFSSFTQAESSHRRKYSGVGVGLAISARLAEIMGGDISVESEQGKGSTFTFSAEFPVIPATGKPKDYTQKIVCFGALTGRILLAEDNHVNRMVAEKVLAKGGHQVIVAHDGKQAVTQWRAEKPDLILMDLQMPEMDGLEATQVIRAEESGFQHVPIVALTANAKSTDQQACFNVGMDYFIAKPFAPKALLDVIQTVLEKVSSHQQQ